MKLLVILGSNRINGQSARVLTLVQNHLKGIASVKALWLKDYKIEYCDADNACSNKDCGLDDGVKKIVASMEEADGILYVPVMHAYGMNSLFQSFMERAGYGFFRHRGRPLRDKVAAVAVVGRRYGHTGVYSQVVLNILLNRMILVGAGFPPTFQSQYLRDAEAEEALLDTLDRMIEHHLIIKHGKRQLLSQKNIIEQIKIQTG